MCTYLQYVIANTVDANVHIMDTADFQACLCNEFGTTYNRHIKINVTFCSVQYHFSCTQKKYIALDDASCNIIFPCAIKK